MTNKKTKIKNLDQKMQPQRSSKKQLKVKTQNKPKLKLET